MLVNVRASDAAGHVTECLLVLHAELWRNGWTLREPAASGEPGPREPARRPPL
jgi:hypothetical protein